MRPLDSTTLSVATALLIGASGSCIALRNWGGYPLLWVIAAIILFLLAVILFIVGWLLPRIFGGPRGQSSGRSGVPTNQASELKAETNFTKKSNGGIELNASVSITSGGDADTDTEDGDEEEGGA